MRLYLDAAVIIYAVEGPLRVRQSIVDLFERSASDFITSRLVRAEVLIKPIRDGDTALVERLEGFLAQDGLRVLDVGEAEIERAIDLRVRYRFKTPDAIHLATAIEHGADRFVTGDAGLKRCAEIGVEVVSPSEA